MRRILRYATALLVGIAVTGGVALSSPPAGRTPILLVGIAQVYAVGAAIALRYRETLRRTDGPSWVSGAFAGVTTFGSLSLLNGVEPTPNFAVAVLGFGLAGFGLVAGVAFERAKHTSS